MGLAAAAAAPSSASASRAAGRFATTRCRIDDVASAQRSRGWCIESSTNRRRVGRGRAPAPRASVDEENETYASSGRVASDAGTSTSTSKDGSKQKTGGLTLQIATGSSSFAGSRVVDFVAAWDAISPRLAESEHEEVNKEMLLSALTLAIPRLQQIAFVRENERSKPAHERAVDVALTLVDQGMDAECISAGLLREAVVHGTVTLDEIEEVLGERVMRLAHDVGRVHDLPGRVASCDSNSAERLRSYFLSFHDIRAIVVELACRLDVLRHIDELEPIQRTTVALETMQIYAPMAHALNTGSLSAELEDLAFKVVFPTSYASLDAWLKAKNPADAAVLDRVSKILSDVMNADTTLNALIGRGGVKVLARRKSRYSTMKKIIRDGRKRDEVHDLLGIRLILTPQPGSGAELPVLGETYRDGSFDEIEARALKAANAACYRAQQIVHNIFPAINGRTKDYISNPKPNGYASLHSTLKVGLDEDGKPLSLGDAHKRGVNVELQIRTAAMHLAAEAGKASHTSYKGGLKEDTGVAGSLADLASAANRAAVEKFGDFTHDDLREHGQVHDRLFEAFDLNGDGRVTINELRTVLSSIWNDEETSQLLEEAEALMSLLDVDNDGCIDMDEFSKFRTSLTEVSALPRADAETLAAIKAVAVESIDEEQEELANDEDVVIDIEARDVTTSGETTIEDEAELIATVRAAVTDSYEYVGRVDSAGRQAAVAMRDTDDGPVEWQLVWDLIKSGRAETARQLFYQRTTRSPGQIGTWEQWARFELLQGDPERSRSLYRAALLHCEDQPLVRAETLRKWAMMELAAKDALHTNSHKDLFARAVVVLAEAESAGRIGTEDSGAAQAKTYQVWAQGEARAGNIHQARTLLDKAEACQAGNPAVAHARGQIEEVNGNYAAAAAAYAMGASVNPTDAFLLQSWARLEAKSGRLDNARTLYRRAVDANPDNHHVAQAWAVSESEHPDGDVTVAREQFQRASSIAPWSVQTWAAWARFEARAQNNARSIETARALYARGLDAEAGNVICLIGLAECESRLGHFAAAREILSQAKDANPEHWGIVFELAKLEERAGAPANASHYYKRARKMKREAKSARPRSTGARGRKSTWDPLEALEREETQSRRSAASSRVSVSAALDNLRTDERSAGTVGDNNDDENDDENDENDNDENDNDVVINRARDRRPKPSTRASPRRRPSSSGASLRPES